MPSNKCIVIGTLATVLRVSRIFGIAPIKLAPLHRTHLGLAPLDGYHVSASRSLRIYSYIFVTVYMIGNYVKIAYIEAYVHIIPKQGIQKLYWMLMHWLQIICYSIIIILSALRGHSRMKLLVDNLNTLERLNWKMNNNYTNIKIKYSKAIFWGFLLVLCFIGAIYTYMSIGPMSALYDGVTLIYFMYFLTYILILLLQLQFVFVVYLVNGTLDVFHKRLQSLIVKSEIHSLFEDKRGYSAHIAIQNLHQIYKAICNLITEIDEKEGILNFFIFIYKVIDLWHGVYILKLSSDSINMSNLVPKTLEIFWIIYRCFMLILLIEPCHQTWKQMIRVLVSRLICVTTEEDTKEVLYSFSYQLILSVPTFSPLGMCTFTRQLLLTTAGAFASYLVILY